MRPDAIGTNKGYNSLQARRYLAREGGGPVIPTKVDQELLASFDRVADPERNAAECLTNRFEQLGRVAPRHESPVADDPAIMMIATLLLRP